LSNNKGSLFLAKKKKEEEKDAKLRQCLASSKQVILLHFFVDILILFQTFFDTCGPTTKTGWALPRSDNRPLSVDIQALHIFGHCV